METPVELERQERRAGAGDAHGDACRPELIEERAHARDHLQPGPFVQAIPQGLGQQRRFGRQRDHGRGSVSGVEDGVGQGHQRWERRTRLAGGQPDVGRDERHRHEVWVRVEPDHAVAERQREAARDRGGRVVRMTLDLDRQLQHLLGLEPEVEQPVGERDPGDAGRRRGPEPSLERDPVDAVERERRDDAAAHARRVRDRRSRPCRSRRWAAHRRPAPSQVTPGAASVSTVTSFHRSSASPKQSKPGPEVRRGRGDASGEAHDV